MEERVHYGPRNEQDPPIDPEVWRKAKRLVTIYRPQLLIKPFEVRTKRWRKQILRKEDGFYYIDTSIYDDVQRKYQQRLGDRLNKWRIGHIEVIDIDVYTMRHRPFIHQVKCFGLFGDEEIHELQNKIIDSPIVQQIGPPYQKGADVHRATCITCFPTLGLTHHQDNPYPIIIHKELVTNRFKSRDSYIPILGVGLEQRFQNCMNVYVNIVTMIYKEQRIE